MVFRVWIHPLLTMSMPKCLQCPISCLTPLQCSGQCAQLSHKSSLKGCCSSLRIMTNLVFLCRRADSQLNGLSEAFYRISRCSGLSPTSHLQLHKYERQVLSRCEVFSTHSQTRGRRLHCQAVKSSSLNSFLCNSQGLNGISEYTGVDERCVPKTTFHPRYTNRECKCTPFRPRLFQGDQNTEECKTHQNCRNPFLDSNFLSRCLR